MSVASNVKANIFASQTFFCFLDVVVSRIQKSNLCIFEKVFHPPSQNLKADRQMQCLFLMCTVALAREYLNLLCVTQGALNNVGPKDSRVIEEILR